MIKVVALLALLSTVPAHGGESPFVDSRLAKMVEDVVRETGFSINISASDAYSVNINEINGRNVCDPASEASAKQLQEAFNRQPGIKDNFGPALFSVTAIDGSRKVLSLDAAVKQGVAKGCTNIYVSVNPK